MQTLVDTTIHTTISVGDLPWEDIAACRAVPNAADLFFSEDIGDIAAAKRLCADCSVLFVPARAMTTTTSDQQRPRRPRYWVGPLVAGACFALGYGITQRVVLMRQTWEKPQQATFRQNSFPGETLDGLRRRYGADQPLMGDVAAKEALDAEHRKANEQAEAIAKQGQQGEQAQQAAVPEPWSVREEPVSTAAPVAAPISAPFNGSLPCMYAEPPPTPPPINAANNIAGAVFLPNGSSKIDLACRFIDLNCSATMNLCSSLQITNGLIMLSIFFSLLKVF